MVEHSELDDDHQAEQALEAFEEGAFMQVFQVKGMSCQHCKRAITAAIHEIDAQAIVEVQIAEGKVSVESQAGELDIARAIEEAGYQVTVAPSSGN